MDVLWLQWLAAEGVAESAEERRGRLVELTKALVQEHLVRMSGRQGLARANIARWCWVGICVVSRCRKGQKRASGPPQHQTRPQVGCCWGHTDPRLPFWREGDGVQAMQ